MWLALASSIVFWGLYYVLRTVVESRLILWPVLLFASLVTLLLIAHLLAFLSNRKKKGSDLNV